MSLWIKDRGDWIVTWQSLLVVGEESGGGGVGGWQGGLGSECRLVMLSGGMGGSPIMRVMVRWSGAECADDEFGSDMVGGRAGGLRCLLRFRLMILTRFD